LLLLVILLHPLLLWVLLHPLPLQPLAVEQAAASQLLQLLLQLLPPLHHPHCPSLLMMLHPSPQALHYSCSTRVSLPALTMSLLHVQLLLPSPLEQQP
jgi:hypothetical protein